MIRCVVFDFDGTLVDSNQIKRQTFFDVAGEFKSGVDLMEEILSLQDAGDRYGVFEKFTSALPTKKAGPDAGFLANRYTQLCEQRIVATPEIAGAGKTLRSLKAAGKFLYINSATPREPLQKIVQLRRLDQWLDGICGAPSGKGKNLLTIMADCEVQPNETLMVGDGETDRRAAEETSCHFIGVRNESSNFQEQPRQLIDDLLGLADLIN